MDEDKKTLVHYCKNCNWKGELENQSKCIYSRNYQDDYIANKVFSNKYTIFDKTLPRVSYACINQECATNMDFNERDMTTILYFDNINADWDTEVLEEYVQQFVQSGHIVSTKRIRLTSWMIQCDTFEHAEEVGKYIKENALQEVVLEPAVFNVPKKEVMYIKYDTVNMKYLYICCVCGSSWKNT